MDTIFATITAIGGSVVVVRISGKDISAVFKILRRPEYSCLTDSGKVSDKKIGKRLDPSSEFVAKDIHSTKLDVDLSVCNVLVHRMSTLLDVLDGESVLDSALVTLFAAPNSFTGENVLEVSLHGGIYIVRRFLSLLEEKCGYRMARNGEFTERAFVNGKLDLVRAEGILAMINSHTEAQHKVASGMYDGSVSKVYNGWREAIIHVMSILELGIDFSEEDLPTFFLSDILPHISSVLSDMKNHLSRFKSCEMVLNGIQIAIVGLPNVGKSSIINTITKKDIAIVTDIPGTTRDSVVATVCLGSDLVRIVDTAGLRDTNDMVEKEGIRRAIEKKNESVFSLIVFDILIDIGQQLESLQIDISYNDIIVLNKSDTVDCLDSFQLLAKSFFPKNDIVIVSAKNNHNFDILIDILQKKVSAVADDSFLPAIINDRHRTAIANGVEMLEGLTLSMPAEILSEELRCVLSVIESVVGVVTTEDVLCSIFSRFCIGK